MQRDYANTTGSASDAAKAEVAAVIADWKDYAERALADLHAKQGPHQPADYDFKEKQLASSVKLAGVFGEKRKTGNYDKDFVATRRDGVISALMIRQLVGKGAFLDDLMVNPRKLYQIIPADAIAGRDDSAAAAVEQVMREAYAKGGDVKLLGGDTSAGRIGGGWASASWSRKRRGSAWCGRTTNRSACT